MGPRGRRFVIAVLFYEPLQLPDPVLLILVCGQLDFLSLRLLFQVEIVVTGKLLDVALVDFDNALNDPVEKGPVVRDENEGRGAVQQVFFEPKQGFEVEVVRRFVQEQQVGFGKKKPRQFEAHDPSAAQLSDRGIEHGSSESQPFEHLGRPRFEIVAHEVFDPLEHVGVPGSKVGQGLRVFLRSQLALQRLQLASKPFCFPMDVHRPGQNRLFRGRNRVLRKVADAQAPRPADISGIGFDFAEQDMEQRGLSRAVGADQADPVARPHVEGNVFQEFFFVEVF